MAYKLSELDKRNLAAFQGDFSRRSLVGISLRVGQIRGLSNLSIKFSYPLSAIAGRNGSGKSTVLALAACAYHNDARGWRLPGRPVSYYRFSDFFVQTQDEVPVEGVSIHYQIRFDRWKPDESMPDGRGDGWQVRRKNKGGKWNDYDTRLKRPVAFFGIDRVVPPSEKSVLKNQRRYFSGASAKKSTIEEAARLSVGRILGVDYKDFELRGFGQHRLPHVKVGTHQYSGFNMGAGEQALFALFSAVHSAVRSTLFVIDEIELGLHEAAQRMLIEELKRIAYTQGHQFIFTTHSPTVLECLPPEGRFFLERSTSGTHVIDGISPAFAAGRMAERKSKELVIYVEDQSAKQLLVSVLDANRRRRIDVVEVGSNSAVVSQANARFIDRGVDERAVLFVLHGDQRAALAAHRSTFLRRVDAKWRASAAEWFDERIAFLPSDLAPERFVVSVLREQHLERLADTLGLDPEEVGGILDKALVRGGHSEIHWIAEDLCLPQEQVWVAMCQVLVSEDSATFGVLLAKIDELLGSSR